MEFEGGVGGGEGLLEGGELGWVAAVEEDVEVLEGEGVGEGEADAVGAAGDEGPGVGGWGLGWGMVVAGEGGGARVEVDEAEDVVEELEEG